MLRSCRSLATPTLPSRCWPFIDALVQRIDCLQQFRSELKLIQVHVAFLYTTKENLLSIHQGELAGTKAISNGASFGKGLYLAMNPHAFSSTGEVGVLVLLLRGVVRQIAQDPQARAEKQDC